MCAPIASAQTTTPGAPQPPAQAARPPDNPLLDPAITAPIEQAVRAAGDAFVAAYNAGDAGALAALFTEGAEIENEYGELIRGKNQEILPHFTDLFARKAGGTLEVRDRDIRLLSLDSAIEEGESRLVPPADEPPEYTRYSVLYVKQDGKWLHARIRDELTPNAPPSAYMRKLAFLVGDWINESDDALVRTSAAFSNDGTFLDRNYEMKVLGDRVLTGTQRIGWDPLHRRFRVWVFDDKGGFGEGFLTHRDDRWLIKTLGVNSLGKPVSYTTVITPQGKDRMSWQIRDLTIGDESLPDLEPNILVRKPPAPAPAPAAEAGK
jgi:uncharacterized protein (TIGR02246 family)